MTNEHLESFMLMAIEKKMFCNLDNNMIINKVCENLKNFLNYSYKLYLLKYTNL
jgi:hypothetical protein